MFFEKNLGVSELFCLEYCKVGSFVCEKIVDLPEKL